MNPMLDLLRPLGRPDPRGWHDYLELGIGPDAEDDLMGLIREPDILWAETGSGESWAALHAWRSLGQLGSVKAIPALLELLTEAHDDDWVLSDLAEVFGRIGPAAVPALSRYLADDSNELFTRATASRALVMIAQGHPEERPKCVGALMDLLEGFERQDELLNSLVIGNLIDLPAVEAAPLIERVFDAGRVDLRHQGDWEDVQIELGLLSERLTTRKPFPPLFGPVDAGRRPTGEREARQRAEAKQKEKAKRKRKAARRSRRRNRP